MFTDGVTFVTCGVFKWNKSHSWNKKTEKLIFSINIKDFVYQEQIATHQDLRRKLHEGVNDTRNREGKLFQVRRHLNSVIINVMFHGFKPILYCCYYICFNRCVVKKVFYLMAFTLFLKSESTWKYGWQWWNFDFTVND